MKQWRKWITTAAWLPFLGTTSVAHKFAPSILAPSNPPAFLPSSYRTNRSSKCLPLPLAPPSPVTIILHARKLASPSHPRDGRRNDISLLMTEDNNFSDAKSREDSGAKFDENTKQLESQNEVPEPPRFLAIGYNAAAIINIIAALVLVRNINAGPYNGAVAFAGASSVPLSTAATAVSARYQPNILATYTAGSLGYLFLAAGSCNILSESVTTKRLYTSDTYKRMTMGTLLFGLLGLISLPGEAGCIASSSTAFGGAFVVTQLAKFATAFVSFLGWEYGAGGFGSGQRRLKNVLGELAEGCRRAWRTLPVSDERPATFYRTFLIFTTLGNLVFNVPELVFNLRQGVGLFSLSASLTISSIARSGLLSVLLYVLKDAAERKRLEGTTFIKLNMMVGLWACGVGIAQGFADGPTAPFNIMRAADKLLFGLFFLNNGIVAQLSKMGVIKKRDEDEPDVDDPPLRIGLF